MNSSQATQISTRNNPTSTYSTMLETKLERRRRMLSSTVRSTTRESCRRRSCRSTGRCIGLSWMRTWEVRWLGWGFLHMYVSGKTYPPRVQTLSERSNFQKVNDTDFTVSNTHICVSDPYPCRIRVRYFKKKKFPCIRAIHRWTLVLEITQRLNHNNCEFNHILVINLFIWHSQKISFKHSSHLLHQMIIDKSQTVPIPWTIISQTKF